MSGKSPVSASEEQRSALMALAGSRDRGEADRARAILLTLSGWASPRIAEAFGLDPTVVSPGAISLNSRRKRLSQDMSQ
ncbi:MAG: hypothetical protein ABSC06_30255 [Rhodopila sp.]|jgi:hypothetical protein